MDHLKQKITTFLMFDGQADEATNFYCSVFDQAEILHIHRYAANEAGAEGTVSHAAFSLDGQTLLCMDSNVKHDFTISLLNRKRRDAENTFIFLPRSDSRSFTTTKARICLLDAC